MKGHCLLSHRLIGIGTLWTTIGLATSSSPTCTYLLNSAATNEYQTLSGCSGAIPIENDYGQGTYCGHWDEECFRAELMTGFTQGLTTLPLSRITIAGLEDLGYSFNYNLADTYSEANMNPACVCGPSKRRDLHGAIDGAVRVIGGEQDGAEKRRRSTEDGLVIAIKYGKSILESRREERSSLLSGLTSDGDGAEYIGDKVIHVLYMEGDQIFDVLVVSDDF